MSFAEFMDEVLYHPDLGYYSKHPDSSDYYTNVDVHPVFAEMLARFFEKEWKIELQGKPALALIELGSGGGLLAKRILAWAREHDKDFYESLSYFCVEKSAARRKSCSALEKDFPGRIIALEAFDFSPESLTAIVFSNEFFDAVPFHRVIGNGGVLKEIRIGPKFEETLSDLTPPLKDYFKWLGEAPRENCVAEAQISAREWMAKIGRALKKGAVLTIDYGFEARELFSEIRSEGTALCHFRHKTSRDFYSLLGDQDITAHVNFTALSKEGERWGLRSSRLMSQTQFIAENCLEDAVKLALKTSNPRERLKINSAIKSLIHPEGMGGVFKVLLQRK